MSDTLDNWERKTITQLALFGVKEHRASRRWGIFFKLLVALYFIALLWVYMLSNPGIMHELKRVEFIPVVELTGKIMPEHGASASVINKTLQFAFRNPLSRGVILKINSPGGTPVQSRLIYNEIVRLRTLYPEKKLIAVIEDLGASGAYLVASSADSIYADETSIIGSIGVVVNSFGFVDAMGKLGVERRLYTAGENKALLDPFSPRNADQEKMLLEQLNIVHQEFITNVKSGRGDRLQANDDIFSGKVWTGVEAKKLGLIDGFADVTMVARDVFKLDKIVFYGSKVSFMEQLKDTLGKVISLLSIFKQ